MYMELTEIEDMMKLYGSSHMVMDQMRILLIMVLLMIVMFLLTILSLLMIMKM